MLSRVRSGRLRAFFKYFGAKHKAAGRYPSPAHGLIVEPFAGSAAYATHHHDRQVLLLDKDPVVAGVWEYLTRASSDEIARLPLFSEGQTHLDELGHLTDAQRDLIGFWLFTGSTFPREKRSSWAMSPDYRDRFWGEEIRTRLAEQAPEIRHWRVQHASYSDAPNIPACWFVDPPYQLAGRVYNCSSADINYADLAAWVRARRGQAIVCENVGADWLPFRPFYDGTASRFKPGGVSQEAVFVMSNGVDITDQVLRDLDVQRTLDEIERASLESAEAARAHAAAQRRVTELSMRLSQVVAASQRGVAMPASERAAGSLDEQCAKVLGALAQREMTRTELAAQLGFDVSDAIESLRDAERVHKIGEGRYTKYRVAG